MMIEGIAMMTVLTGMGVYFVKSADLSKELKMRSEQLKMEALKNPIMTKRKYSFEPGAIQMQSSKKNRKKVLTANNDLTKKEMNIELPALPVEETNKSVLTSEERELMAQLEQKMKHAKMLEANKIETQMLEEQVSKTKKMAELEAINRRIDQITMAITTLEQELKANNSRNNEIQDLINKYLTQLSQLNSKKLA